MLALGQMPPWGQKGGLRCWQFTQMCFEGTLKPPFQLLACPEMCFQGMGAKGGLRCWHWVKCVLRAWGLEKGVSGVGTG